MKNREIWLMVDVKDVVKNVEVEKALKCYDFKAWEREEILNLKNNTELSLNEFRWDYVRGTLEITDSNFKDIGIMVKDLIEDIKMGYHRISDDEILKDIENSNNINSILDNAEEMKFEYIPYRDYETGRVSTIAIYYDKECTYEEKEKEINEICEYLNLNVGQVNIVSR